VIGLLADQIAHFFTRLIRDNLRDMDDVRRVSVELGMQHASFTAEPIKV
jgi:hypothetical protein